MMNAFSGLHPAVSFTYFTFVILYGMTLTDPVCQLISLLCAVCFAIQLNGRKAVAFTIKLGLPVFLMAALVNPAFNHAGVTLLCYLPTGNPLTLESILYGVSAGVMLACMLIWFMCFSAVVTSDKFIWLFGRIIPALSLVLSMSLRFVPKFRAQLTIAAEAQRGLDRDIYNGGIFKRLSSAITVLSSVITWALENAIETADSMKSRGYGLKGRTAYSIYTLDERNKYLNLWILFCGIFVLCGMICGQMGFRYFPSIRGAAVTGFAVSFRVIYFALCVTPIIFNGREERLWKSSRSKL